MGKNNILEEVTITPVIRDIERLFNKVLSIIGCGFKLLYKGIIAFILFSLKNIYWLLIAVVVGGLGGYYSTLVVPQTYSSHLILRPSINAKEQLNADVNFFNSLILKKELTVLSEILKISEEDAQCLSKMIVEPYASYLDKIDMINSMYKTLDTTTHKHINFESLLDDDNKVFSRDLMITVTATNQSVFSRIEPELINYLERVPELQALRKNELDILKNQKETFLQEMLSLDSLKKVLNEVMIEQAKSSNSNSKNSTISFDKSNTQSAINPLEIYSKKMDYANKIAEIDKRIGSYKSCYQIFAHFSEYGYKSGLGRLAKTVILSLFLFMITCFLLALKKVN